MDLIELTNGTVVVGVVPPLGGRVVLLKTAGGENLLDSDPRLWKPPFPPPALDTPFKPWNGRVVWVGPQTGFWSQQDLKADRKKQRAGWPPDPFNETGRFDVVERTATLLRLEGATSPVTGLAFEHEYEITGERTVRMKTTATNGRTTPVSWDLWPNTRVRTEGFPYVLTDPLQMLRMDGPRPDDAEVGAYPSEVRGGWLTLPPGRKPESGRKKLWAKAYVRPAIGTDRVLPRPAAPRDPRARSCPGRSCTASRRSSSSTAGRGRARTTSSSSRCTGPTRRSPPAPR